MEAPRAPSKEGLAHNCGKGGQRAAWSFSFLLGQPQLFQQHHSFPETANIHSATATGGPGGMAIQPDGYSFSSSFLLDQLGLGDSQLALDSTSPLLSAASSFHKGGSPMSSSHFHFNICFWRTLPESRQYWAMSVHQNSLLAHRSVCTVEQFGGMVLFSDWRWLWHPHLLCHRVILAATLPSSSRGQRRPQGGAKPAPEMLRPWGDTYDMPHPACGMAGQLWADDPWTHAGPNAPCHPCWLLSEADLDTGSQMQVVDLECDSGKHWKRMENKRWRRGSPQLCTSKQGTTDASGVYPPEEHQPSKPPFPFISGCFLGLPPPQNCLPSNPLSLSLLFGRTQTKTLNWCDFLKFFKMKITLCL